MLVHIVVLLILLMIAAYSFMNCFKYITHQQWKKTGKVTVKLVLAAIFAVGVIAFLGCISRLTN